MFEEHGFQYYFRIAFTNTSRKENSHTFFWLQFKDVLSSLLFQYPLKKKKQTKSHQMGRNDAGLVLCKRKRVLISKNSLTITSVFDK